MRGLVNMRPATLRAFRQIRGWSQRQLADKARVSESLIAQIESGRRQPGLGNAQSLADALGIPLDALAIVTDPDDELEVVA